MFFPDWELSNRTHEIKISKKSSAGDWSQQYEPWRRVQYLGSLKQRQCFRRHGLHVFFFDVQIWLLFVNDIGGCHRTENPLVVWIPWLCREKSYEKGFLISGNWMLFRNNKIRLERSMILCIVSVPHGKWASPRIDVIVEALDILFEQ